MKKNKITIEINKPVEEVFLFTTNPKNTSFWIDSVEVEKSNEWPPKLGTIYRNRGTENIWNKYRVVNIKENEVFELFSSDGNYHARYTYKDLGGKAELEYFEWVDSGDIEDPFTQSVLGKLKTIMESEG